MSRRSIALSTVLFLLFLLLCFQVLSQTDGSAALMEEKEKQALYSMVQGFVGRWWNGSQLYPDPCGWTPIQGVSCDLFANGVWYVTVVSIGPIFDNSLECAKDAEFSPHLFELGHLRSLSIFNCFSASDDRPSTIPVQNWSKLSSTLENLEFRLNRGLSGEIPAGLGRLVNLQTLVLADNSLGEGIPWELGMLVHLKRLTLSGNQLSGQVPASLGANLAELLIMDLSSNHLIGTLPSSFGGLSSLLKLDLSNNLLNGSLPQELGNLKNLTLLDLRNNKLSGELVHFLQGMVSLQVMALSNNPFGGKIEDFDWKRFGNLTHLDLSNMSLVGEIPDSITELKNLRFLALDNNQLSGFVPAKLAAMPWLSTLYINGNNLSGELGFPEAFYERTGRRFASWNNPNLCYKFSAESAIGDGLVGVKKCIYGEGSSKQDVDFGNKIYSGEPTQGSDYIASFGSLAYTLDEFLTFLEVVVILFNVF